MCKVLNAKSASVRARRSSTSAARANGATRSSSDATAPADVIAKYRAWIVAQPALMDALDELRGPRPHLLVRTACHGDVLIELANRR